MLRKRLRRRERDGRKNNPTEPDINAPLPMAVFYLYPPRHHPPTERAIRFPANPIPDDHATKTETTAPRTVDNLPLARSIHGDQPTPRPTGTEL
jgi:hypothetical protein